MEFFFNFIKSIPLRNRLHIWKCFNAKLLLDLYAWWKHVATRWPNIFSAISFNIFGKNFLKMLNIKFFYKSKWNLLKYFGFYLFLTINFKPFCCNSKIIFFLFLFIPPRIKTQLTTCSSHKLEAPVQWLCNKITDVFNALAASENIILYTSTQMPFLFDVRKSYFLRLWVTL